MFIVSRSQNAAQQRHARPGTATVDFVLATLLVTLTMGMVEVTRAIQVKDFLTDAARSGCRMAIQSGNTNTEVTNNINACLTANGFSTSQATVTIKVNDVVANVSTAKKYDKISVQISIPLNQVNWVSPLFFSNTSVTTETVVMI